MKTFILVVLFVWLSIEVGHVGINGKWLSDKKYLPVVENLLKHGEIYKNIIYTSDVDIDRPYIGIVNLSILAPYRIQDVGVIPRWTKMHKLISDWISRNKKDVLKNALK